MLRKAGFQAYTIDEFRTSKVCRQCGHTSLAYTNRRCTNLRPYRCEQNSQVLVHGLLRYTDQGCQEFMATILEYDDRLYNRNTAACLNMLNIVHHLRQFGTRLRIFRYEFKLEECIDDCPCVACSCVCDGLVRGNFNRGNICLRSY